MLCVNCGEFQRFSRGDGLCITCKNLHDNDYEEQPAHESIVKQDNIATCSTCKHYAEETLTETGGIALCSEKAVNVPGASEEMDCHEPRSSTAAPFPDIKERNREYFKYLDDMNKQISSVTIPAGKRMGRTWACNNIKNYIWGADLSRQPEPLRCTRCEIELRNITPTIFRDGLLCQNCAKKPLTEVEATDVSTEIKAINTLISALSDPSGVSDGKHTFGEYRAMISELTNILTRQ